ncbi:Type I restriction-modification system, DNA methylase subunit [Flavobacterium fluvii]|uniref:site-specific DNA-methyltransferase (adenine-specific) n=1 Tax=Flavobacterium fluvii TaxID=468056 RepID=A0A1M5F0C4_9FLAO|nr:DNA methyltransferase [Flavobacterium fluvii]SHF84985.1 Type I restriction-modification system, DNA methylase subunit [Flavobacterium fluvii]
MEKIQENELLIEVLKKLDFFSTDSSIENDFPEIVFAKNPPLNLHPKHYIALEFAEILEADAVYFKYYDDNRFCVPQVYFYDNSSGIYDKNKIAEIHRNVYSSCQVNIICFIEKTTLSLFDTRQPIKIKSLKSKSNELFSNEESISNEDCIIEKEFELSDLVPLKKFFSAKKLNTNLFWETDEAAKHFSNNTSAYGELVKALNLIRKSFIEIFKGFEIFKENLDDAESLAQEILFKCILIKYLEENGKTFAEEFYKEKKLKYSSLYDFLYNNNFIELLEKFENHFNGNVFDLNEDKKELIKKINLSSLAECLEGKLGSNKTLYLWKMYSFKYIPIELISNFYEEFIPKIDKKIKGTVYTPSFLVNFLIDECLPISNKKNDLNYNVKLADVSCGSGIFITSAFKRLVQRWRVAKMENGILAIPKLEIVQNILTNNIFGVDIHPTSVKLSKFSLLLAMCQMLPNEEIWYKWTNEKVFKDTKRKVFINLNNNVFKEDFFDFLTKEEYHKFHNSFDLIIGNPPFKLIGKIEYLKHINKLKTVGFEFKVEVPRYQLALMFLEASGILLKEKADLCFIQKSTSLIHNKKENSQNYKSHFFNQFYVHQIIDFTLLKDVLFEKALVETCAIFYKKEKKQDYSTLHIVSKLLKNTKDGISFEFDYYDFFEIPKESVCNEKNIWRINLLGSNRLNHLINKLEQKTSTQTNLEDYLYNILKFPKKRYAEGYMVKNNVTKNPKKADYLNGKFGITANNIDHNSFTKEMIDKDIEFHRIVTKELFTAPQILIKESIEDNNIPIHMMYEDTPFDSRIIGISADQDYINYLEILYETLIKNQRVYCLQSISTSSQFYFRGNTAIQKQDIDNWAIPLNGTEIKLSFAEKIIMNDVLDFTYPSWQLGEDAKTNKIISKKEENKILYDFADIFNQSFNSIYKKENKEQRLRKLCIGNDFYALEFYYSNENHETKIIENADFQIEEIIKNNVSRNAVVNRVLKIYGENTITFIKPKNLRFWLKSIALRDADDVFDDIIENGLK